MNASGSVPNNRSGEHRSSSFCSSNKASPTSTACDPVVANTACTSNCNNKERADGQNNDNNTPPSTLLTFPQANNIPFPYPTPYHQQLDLMDALLETLRLKELAETATTTAAEPNEDKLASILFLESPTGTGKSLSLASASLAWLIYRDEKDLLTEKEKEGKASLSSSTNNNQPNETTSSSWWDAWEPPEQRRAEQEVKEMRESAFEARQELGKVLRTIRTKVHRPGRSSNNSSISQRRQHVLREALTSIRSQNLPPPRKQTKTSKLEKKDEENDIEKSFCLEDYHSEEESEKEAAKRFSSHSATSEAGRLLDGSRLDGSGRHPSNHTPTFSNSLLTSLGGSSKAASVGNVAAGSGVRKIIYAARTHSQLSQFVHELDKLREKGHYQDVRVLALGGRPALCGNPSLAKKSDRVVNEACLDMQKTGSSICTETSVSGTISTKKRSKRASSGCPLLSDRDAVDTLALHVLSEPMDIEEAATMGKSTQTCSYYASRTALAAAQVVVLPYSLLLSKDSRQAIGLQLPESLVLIDEAHNVPEALRQVHSCHLTEPVVKMAVEQMQWYLDKYKNRLAGRNLYYVGQIRMILQALQKAFAGKLKVSQGTMMTGMELLCALRLDKQNLPKILGYLNQTRLPQKLHGYATHRNKQIQQQQMQNAIEEDDGVLSKHVSAMAVVQTFLEKILVEGHGKFLLERSTGTHQQASFRFVLLQPAVFLQNVLKEAHAVAFVGGTMQPFQHVSSELLDSPDFGALATQADSAIRQQQFVSSRGSSSIISSKFTAFSCGHVVSPENVLLQRWSTSPSKIRLDFRMSNRSDKQWDELGQCLLHICQAVPHGMVVFLPSYAFEKQLFERWNATGVWKQLGQKKKLHREPKASNQIESTLASYAKDAQSSRGALLFSVIGGRLSEGINFSDDLARCVAVCGLPYPNSTDPILKEKCASSSISGRSYVHNLCMRAVNQAIGRAVRHANDYSSVILLDQRYETNQKVWDGLPAWLKEGQGGKVVPFPKQIKQMQSFFAKHAGYNESKTILIN